MAAILHLGTLQNSKLLTIDKLKMSKCVTVPNFIAIRPAVAEL